MQLESHARIIIVVTVIVMIFLFFVIRRMSHAMNLISCNTTLDVANEHISGMN